MAYPDLDHIHIIATYLDCGVTISLVINRMLSEHCGPDNSLFGL